MNRNRNGAREFTYKITQAARKAMWETNNEKEYRRAVWQAMGRIRTRGPIRYATKRHITKVVIDRVWNEPDLEHLDEGQASFMEALRDEIRLHKDL